MGKVRVVGAVFGDEVVFELEVEFGALGEVDCSDCLIVGDDGGVFVGVKSFEALGLVEMGAFGVVVFDVGDFTKDYCRYK